jgi:site-specific DNA-methyltransferase (adenine-specific)
LDQKVFSDRNPELASADMPQNRSGNAKANHHPTVKPIALMEYLIKMVTPKGGIVLDPFAGSGSTLVAAKQNGYGYIGIEMTPEYIPIIEARLNSISDKLF